MVETPKNENSRKIQKIMCWVDMVKYLKNENCANFQNNLCWVDPHPRYPATSQDK